MSVDPLSLRAVLRAHASGVAVMTAATASGPLGMTISSLTSLSLRPPLVSFAMANSSSTWRAAQDCRVLALQLLGADQADLAHRFAQSRIERFGPGVEWRPGSGGVPLIEGCLSWLVCTRRLAVPAGDHSLVICEVKQAIRGDDGVGLVHVNGRFHLVAPDALPVAH